jgi:uncharacterized protein (DUF2235 family)
VISFTLARIGAVYRSRQFPKPLLLLGDERIFCCPSCRCRRLAVVNDRLFVGAPVPHRIIVLSDGTGNSAAKVWRTNVWRIFEFLDLTGSDQVAKYDDGVGSSAFKPLALLGGAFGWGLKRNVIDLYKFICRNYRAASVECSNGSEIYGFGFSRGAFTVRILIGLILRQGLVPYYSEADLDTRTKAAYRAFRAERFHSVLRIERIFRCIRDNLIGLLDRVLHRKPYTMSDNIAVPSIEFVGVWDTVAAYGLPIEEMTRGFSRWIWPLELPTRTLDPRVNRVCHALALDDERTTFHPVLWNEKGENIPVPDKDGKIWLKEERISQVWFVGSHSNVGGGYPDDALAYIPLYWVMEEARARGLRFKVPPADPDAFRRAASGRDKDGRQYDSRSGLAGYYRYGPRKLTDLCHMRLSNQKGDSVDIDIPKIHETALLRLRSGGNAYAPIGIPADYAVAMLNGEIVHGANNPYESPAEAAARAVDQEKIWNLVWLRRIVYFTTIGASFHLGAFWLFYDIDPEREFQSSVRLVSEFVRLVESFLPRQVVHWWTDYYAANPISFLLGVIAVAVFISFGSRLGAQITDSMRVLWNARLKVATLNKSMLHRTIYAFRTSTPYQMTLDAARRHVLPFLSAVFLIWLALGVLSHFLFNVADSAGAFCHDTDATQRQVLEKKGDKSKELTFSIRALCFATGIELQRGGKYSLTLSIQSPWQDAANPIGYWTSQAPDWESKAAGYVAQPLRRVFFRPWFRLLARIGSKGVAEDFLDPLLLGGKPVTTYWAETKKTDRAGELFLYVNGPVFPLPWIADIFYWHHRGEARFVIERES